MPLSLIKILFPPPQFPTQYLAMGCLFGKFTPSPPTEEQGKYLVRGSLQINEVVYLDVVIKSRTWLKLSESPTFNPENAYLWRVYFRTTVEGKLGLVELTRGIPIEGHLSLSNPPPSEETGVDQFYIRGKVRYTDDQKVVVLMKRNKKPPEGQEQSRQWKPFLMTIASSIPEAKIDDFWDLFCVRKGDSLILTKATLARKARKNKKLATLLVKTTSETPSDSNDLSLQPEITETSRVEETPVIKKPSTSLVTLPVGQKNQSSETLKESFTEQSDSNFSSLQVEITETSLVQKTPLVKKPSTTPVSHRSSTLKEILTEQSNTNITPNQAIMIPGKQAEITVKFNTRPELPEVGKTVLLEIKTEQGFTVRANINRKSLKKQVEKMDTFTDWIGALSGKITRIDPNGVVELEGAGVVVFEKKAKEEVVSDVELVAENVEA